jgi:hypothetical protein
MTALRYYHGTRAELNGDGELIGAGVPRVYEVEPLARRCHFDARGMRLLDVGTPFDTERTARWSGKPVRVVQEMRLPWDVWKLAAKLIELSLELSGKESAIPQA